MDEVALAARDHEASPRGATICAGILAAAGDRNGVPARARGAPARARETERTRASTPAAPRASSRMSRGCSPGPPCCSRSLARSIRRRLSWRGPGGGRPRRRRRSSGRRRRSRSAAATRARSPSAHARPIRRRRCSSRGRRWRRAASGRSARRWRISVPDAARSRQRFSSGLGRLAARTPRLTPRAPARRLSTTRCRPTSTASPRSSPAIWSGRPTVRTGVERPWRRLSCRR